LEEISHLKKKFSLHRAYFLDLWNTTNAKKWIFHALQFENYTVLVIKMIENISYHESKHVYCCSGAGEG